jgi:polysaccharide export outer membrane protein
MGMRSQTLVILAALLAIVMVCGCSGKNKVLNAKLRQMARNPEQLPEYRVAAPDQLSIEVKGYPEYSRSVIVRPDGKITVPSVGDIAVQGLTTPEITAAVTEGLKKELSQPSVTVSVIASTSKAVYVWGEVRTPGSKPYFGDMTLADAIGTSGDVSLYADWTKVIITRGNIDNPEILKINLKKLVLEGKAEQNVVLKEGDIIYVPPTPLAKAGYAMDQLLFPFRSVLSGLVTYGGVKSAFNDNNSN